MRTIVPLLLSSRRCRANFFVIACVVSAATLGACGGREAAPATDSAVANGASSAATNGASSAAGGALIAPHGGLLIPVGNGVAQLEFNVDSTEGVVLVHVLDGKAKEPLRLTQGRIDLTMLDLVEGAGDVNTVLAAKANPKTNETFDNTSVFVGFVPQLVGRMHFKARIQRIEVGGQVFTDIPISYPPDAHA